MLTDSRKRHRSCDSEDDQQLSPQAKKSSGGPCLLVSDLGRDAWDTESSSSDSSNGIGSSPERALQAGSGSSSSSLCSQNPCLSLALSLASRTTNTEDAAGISPHGFHGSVGESYDYINKVLREAHFSSLQSRGRRGST